MTRLKAHYDGKGIVLDETPPATLEPDTPVEVVIPDDEDRPLAALLRLASPGGLPSDYAAQHDHYVKGLPKR